MRKPLRLIAAENFESRSIPFYAPVSKDRGHVVLPLSVCLHKLNMKT